MDFAEQLRILQGARNNPALLALAMVDLAHHALPAAERARVKDALLAAAMPHWCDPDYLATLLETTPEEGHRLLSHLRALTVVEPFRARGEHAVNVHEATRLALRDHLRTTDAARWKALSNRAMAHVHQGTQAHFRIEALYHFFAVDQHAAATACEALDREFTNTGGPEARHALALALSELAAAGWLTGAAKIEALLASLEHRDSRGETAQLEREARNVLALARRTSHPSYRVVRAQVMLGSVFMAKGRRAAALTAYGKGLAITKRLIKTDPSNANWKRDLAVIHVKISDIATADGHHTAALAAYRKALAIFKQLAAIDPSNLDLQDNLAFAHSRVGDIVRAQGHRAAALVAYRKALVIFKDLAASDRSNLFRQNSLAYAHGRIGDIYKVQGRHSAALAAYRKALAIGNRIDKTDPSNVYLKDELAYTHSRIGDIARAQSRRNAALAAYHKARAIFELYTVTYPYDSKWQRELALTHNNLGQVFKSMGDHESAESSFRAAVATMKQAISMSPGKTSFKQELDTLELWLRPYLKIKSRRSKTSLTHELKKPTRASLAKLVPG